LTTRQDATSVWTQLADVVTFEAMATKEQCAFFEKLYNEECSREVALNNYSAGLLSLITLYSGVILFASEHSEKIKLDVAADKYLFLATISVMTVGFLLVIFARQVVQYEALIDPDSVIDQFGDTPMSDEQFFDYRIADYQAAINANVPVNDTKANRLTAATYCLGAGILLYASLFILSIW
jgi:hypothetical protein